MAPTKRQSDKQGQAKLPERASAASSTRVTRSSARVLRGATGAIEKPPVKSVPPPSKKKSPSFKKAKISPNIKAEEEQVKATVDGSNSKTIVIEHCKQCNQFKIRAFKVKDGLESGVSGITVLINPEKPRRGCFEIREEGGEKFISLLDMKRPFTPMKALDMDNVISDIINKIK